MIGNVGQETYLGVRFEADSERVEPGQLFPTKLILLYYPHPDYSPLVTGATFTIREGARVVGYGRVSKGLDEHED